MSFQTLNEMIRTQARVRGDAIACRTPQGTWTFAEVDAASNRVAQALRAHLGGRAPALRSTGKAHTWEAAGRAFVAGRR